MTTNYKNAPAFGETREIQASNETNPRAIEVTRSAVIVLKPKEIGIPLSDSIKEPTKEHRKTE